MKSIKMLEILVLALVVVIGRAEVGNAAPMGTVFTYQGRLIDANSAADGLYDFQFKLYDDPCTGTQQGSTITLADTDVIDGYFTVELDFGGSLFNGEARWLEISVRPVEDKNPKIWLNDGQGCFSDSGQSLGSLGSRDVALGDLDGDDDIDAFVANSAYGDDVWLNNGRGIFNKSGQSLGDSTSYAVALGDLDGDDDLDAFVANFGQANNVWLNDGLGQFSDSGQSLNGLSSRDVALGDLDDDGDLDAFVANSAHGDDVWLNSGRGIFSRGQSLGSSASYAVALGDLDGDGDLDAFISNYYQDNKICLNDGKGRFSDSGQSLSGLSSRDVALGDLDGDGDLDAFVVNSAHGDDVWLNDGRGVFNNSGQSLNGTAGYAVALAELDGDDDLDAFVANYNQANKIWLNDGQGYFSDSGQSLGGSSSHGMALGDLDGDGDIDAFVANYSQISNSFITLSPRQEVTPTPYALYAKTTDGDNDWAFSGNDMYSLPSGNVGIGTSSPSAKLDVAEDLNVSSAYKIRGDIVLSTSDTENTLIGVGAGANNTGSFTTLAGYNAGYSNEGSSNTFVGDRAGLDNTTGNLNTFMGARAGLANTEGIENTFLGHDTGGSNTTGSYNTFVGASAGFWNTEGVDNTFLGQWAGYWNTGDENTFLGTLAGFHNTTGASNTFVGENTGLHNTEGQFNTFLGQAAGSSNTEGVNNTYVGRGAGTANTTGSFNTFIGNGAGFLNSEGSRNVFIGWLAGSNEYGSDKLYIANGVADSNTLICGDFSARTVGIGTRNPAGNLHVEGTVRVDQKMMADDSGGLELATDDGITRLFLADDGNIGIGTTNPELRLHVSGGGILLDNETALWGKDSNDVLRELVKITGLDDVWLKNRAGGNIILANTLSAGGLVQTRLVVTPEGNVGIGTKIPGTFKLAVNGAAAKPGGGSWSDFSDVRLKEVGSDFERGLSAVTKLNPVHYSYSDDNELELPADKEYIGLVAQEVQNIIPEAVEENDKGYLMVNNDPIIWAMVNAIKELKMENDMLKHRIQALERKQH